VFDAALSILGRGEELTFANLSEAAGVPERTFYRHFPNRTELLSAVFEVANQRVGFKGHVPTEQAGVVALLRQVFRGFDAIAPVVLELLTAPEGREVRLSDKRARQRAFIGIVQNAVPRADRTRARRLAAIIQLLTSAAAWQSLRDYWDMDGAEAAETSAIAIELLLERATARRDSSPRTPTTRRSSRKPQRQAKGR
jgi:AcrR family transcriptional regulator